LVTEGWNSLENQKCPADSYEQYNGPNEKWCEDGFQKIGYRDKRVNVYQIQNEGCGKMRGEQSSLCCNDNHIFSTSEILAFVEHAVAAPYEKFRQHCHYIVQLRLLLWLEGIYSLPPWNQTRMAFFPNCSSPIRLTLGNSHFEDCPSDWWNS
jgi:hypothetical protein